MDTMKYLFLALINASLLFATELPNETIRLKIFDKMIEEIERIDGEGLLARINRPESWKATIAHLRKKAASAKTTIEYGQVFRKLDMTYPNLHANLVLNEEFDIAAGNIRPQIAAGFGAEVVDQNQTKYQYKIKSIKTEMLKDLKESKRPAMGDELLAINGISMVEWSKENFIYCKFPLKQQCEMNIFDHFRKGYLFWEGQELEYKLKRNGRIWNVKIPFEISSSAKKNYQPDIFRAGVWC